MNKKILIIQTAFIGDVVLATALLEKLHQGHPDASLTLLVRKGNEGLFKQHPYLHQLFIWDKKNGKYKDLFRLLKLIRSEKFDLVVNVQRFAATGILTAFSGAKETIGFDKNPLSFLFSKRIRHIISDQQNPLHEVERNQQLIQHITDDAFALPVLYPSADDYAKIREFNSEPYICIAPASVWYTKQYPEEKWVELVKRISSKVYIIGGPGDFPLGDRIANAVHEPERVINLCGKLNFLESAALQKGAKRNIVNDSAPMHFASAVNAPVTAIYCSTIPGFGYGPLSTKRAIVETPEKLSCRPCGLHGHKQCPRGDFACAYSISTEQILETIQITG